MENLNGDQLDEIKTYQELFDAALDKLNLNYENYEKLNDLIFSKCENFSFSELFAEKEKEHANKKKTNSKICDEIYEEYLQHEEEDKCVLHTDVHDFLISLIED